MDIIIKSFNGIGDALFVTPTLQVIKEAYPESRIVINTNYPEIFKNNPWVDVVGSEKAGVFLGYPDPIHGVEPRGHHIISDWLIVCRAYGLTTAVPELKPQVYCTGAYEPGAAGDYVAVQITHKNQWGAKKVWGKFEDLARLPGFRPISKAENLKKLMKFLKSNRLVVCAEGAISHLCRALDVPCVVIFGGWASPEWNGYDEQINITNKIACSYCYNPRPCGNDKKCMAGISIEQVQKICEGANI